MKKTITQLTLILISSCLYGQILDGNFEKWDTAFYWENPPFSQFEIVPRDWQSNNQIHPDWHPFLVSTPASQSDESPFGDYSLQLESKDAGIDSYGSGILFQDISAESVTEISYWLKCDVLIDVSGCMVEIFGLGQGLDLIYQDSIYEEHTDFNHYSVSLPDINTANYDSIRLQFRAIGNGGFTDEPLGFTRILIDGVEARTSTSTSNLSSKDANIFPNPTSGLLSIESTDSNILQISLTDTDGKELLAKTCNKQACELDISNQPTGLYLVQIQFANGDREIRRVFKNSL